MIPHERTTLTSTEEQMWRTIERSLGGGFHDPHRGRSWPFQLAGVIIVAVSAFLLGGLTSAARIDSLAVEAAIGFTGLLIGAVLAIDPVRRFAWSLPLRSVTGWRRLRRCGVRRIRIRLRRRRAG